jgi:hypothetical protein
MRRQRLLDVKLWLRNEAALSRAVHPGWRTESSLTKAATDPMDVRLSGKRVPPLCVARALDSYGERQRIVQVARL